jgi:hypothetical protein
MAMGGAGDVPKTAAAASGPGQPGSGGGNGSGGGGGGGLLPDSAAQDSLLRPPAA